MVEISSTVEPAVLLDRIQDGLASSDWRASPYGLDDSRVVKGRASAARLRLYAGRRGRANSWRRWFVGRVVSGAEGGSVIHGELRLLRPVAVFTAVWISGLAGFSVLAVAVLVTSLVLGDTHAFGSSLALCGGVVVMWVGAAALFGFAAHAAARDEAVLMDWLRKIASSGQP
jgi:hypothetical protein